MHHILFCLDKNHVCQSIDLILSQTGDANEDHSHSKFVEDWRTQMSVAYQKALQNPSL